MAVCPTTRQNGSDRAHGSSCYVLCTDQELRRNRAQLNRHAVSGTPLWYEKYSLVQSQSRVIHAEIDRLNNYDAEGPPMGRMLVLANKDGTGLTRMKLPLPVNDTRMKLPLAVSVIATQTECRSNGPPEHRDNVANR